VCVYVECVYCSVHWKLQGRSVSNICGLHQVQHMHVTDLRGSGEQMNLIVARLGGTVKVRHHLLAVEVWGEALQQTHTCCSVCLV
jgi:hypothetical protein